MTTTSDVIVVHATAHPVGQIHRAGFPLDHPYVERCWAPVLGPSSVLVLRRMPELFKGSPDPFIHLDELGRGLGIGGTGKHSAIRTSGSRRGPDLASSTSTPRSDRSTPGGSSTSRTSSSATTRRCSPITSTVSPRRPHQRPISSLA